MIYEILLTICSCFGSIGEMFMSPTETPKPKRHYHPYWR